MTSSISGQKSFPQDCHQSEMSNSSSETLMVKFQNGKELEVSKKVLAYAGDFFVRIFEGNWSECKAKTVDLSKTDFDPELFEVMLSLESAKAPVQKIYNSCPLDRIHEFAMMLDFFQNSNPNVTQWLGHDVERIKASGVVGLDEQINVLFEAMISRLYKISPGRLISRKKLPVFINLYGPPGTGKTTLVRKLLKEFECLSERLKLVSFPELHNSYIGEYEMSIRKLFQPAYEAWTRSGEDSPLYVVVIDDIDRVSPIQRFLRSGGLVNSLFGSLTQLELLNNLLVIGITRESVRTKIPERSSFLFVGVGLPDLQARIEILEYYLQPLWNKNLINADVHVAELATRLDGFAGDQIQDLICLASSISLKRVMGSNRAQREGFEYPPESITMDDFNEGLVTLFRRKNHAQESIPISMYI